MCVRTGTYIHTRAMINGHGQEDSMVNVQGTHVVYTVPVLNGRGFTVRMLVPWVQSRVHALHCALTPGMHAGMQ